MDDLVRDDYPVERLPADLRPPGLTSGVVRVTVHMLGDMFDRFDRIEPIGDDPVERIRSLRDQGG